MTDHEGVDVSKHSNGRFWRADMTAEDATPRSIAKMVGEVIYAFRLSDGVIKIGYTANLADRGRKLGCRWDQMLAIMPGTRADETEIHKALIASRAHDHEFYRATPEVLAFVNQMRDYTHMPHIAA